MDSNTQRIMKVEELIVKRLLQELDGEAPRPGLVDMYSSTFAALQFRRLGWALDGIADAINNLAKRK
jgi:hypothetical protein